MDDDFGADIAGAAGTIIDDELLAEMLRQRIRQKPRGDVGSDAGGIRHDDADRPRRVIRRAGDARQCGERRRDCGKVQKPAAGNYHDASRTRADVSRLLCWRT